MNCFSATQHVCNITNTLFLFSILYCMGCAPGVTLHKKPSTVTLGNGWAANSINTVVFRKNSLASIGDTQYIAWYNQEGFVVLGKRILPAGKWTTVVTRFKGNVSDAHNTICIMPDGDGYLHIAWDHHNNALRYCKSIAPGSLELTDKMPMTDTLDSRVTYPEFHRLPNGNLLFLYRNGQSGEGNLVINRYDIHTRKWTRLHSNLIDGEGQRNAYWQACTDEKGTIHVSWVWRETSDVASNHDLCYARSTDAGATWEKSNGDQYQLPINGASAEYICHIPQKMELINQTAMSADAAGNPLIASYWREANDAVPQYHVVFRQNNKWVVQNTGFRKTAFSLSGAGTKRIPISRPQIISWKKKQRVFTAIVFRDEERGNKISIAYNNDSSKSKWQVRDLLREGVGSWEPTYDTEWWKRKKSLHLFVQLTDQQDGEGKSNIAPQPVSVLQWNP